MCQTYIRQHHDCYMRAYYQLLALYPTPSTDGDGINMTIGGGVELGSMKGTHTNM